MLFLLVRPTENVFFGRLDDFGSFRKFRRVVPFLLFACMFFSVKILHKSNKISLTVTHIAVSLTLTEKWPLVTIP